MTTIININVGGMPLNQERAVPVIETRSLEPGFDFLSEREFTPRYYLGLTPIPDQIFTRAKNCKKGQGCGGSCISLSKTCRKTLTSGQKGAAKNAWVATKGKKSSGMAEGAMKAGKGDVEAAKVKPGIDKAIEEAKSKNKGGALAVLDKKKAEQTINAPRFEGDRQAEIDKKYASDKPTSKDVDAWTKETIANITRPEARDMVVAQSMLFDAFPGDKKLANYMDKVKDEATFVEAYVALNAMAEKKRGFTKDGKTYTPADVDYWRMNFAQDPDVKKKYEQAQRIINDPKKTEERKAKAQKVIDKFEAKEKEMEVLAQKRAAEFVARQNDPMLQRQVAKEAWDGSVGFAQSRFDESLKGLSSKKPEERGKAKTFFEGHVSHTVAPDNLFGYGTNPEEAIRTRLRGKSKNNVLGEPKTKAELKKAFKDFALKNHPDKGGDTALFQAVSAQYNEMLSYLD